MAAKPQIALAGVDSPPPMEPLVVQTAPAAQQSWLGLAWGGTMLISGTLCTVSAKILFDTKAEGSEICMGTTYCSFNKPWFTVFVMKCAMSSCVFFHMASRTGSEMPASAKTLLKISLPSFLDLLNVLLSNIGLLWVSASIYQMTRGSVVIFSAMLSVQLLRRRLLAYQYWAVGLVTAAIILVGVAGILASGAGSSSVTEIIVGLLLILVSQIVLSYQIVVEERMMTEDGVTPFQLTGYEGLWGLLYFAVLIPILTFTPGNPDPNKPPSPMLAIYHEDFRDSFEKFHNSGQVVLWVVVYFFVIAIYNVSGQAWTVWSWIELFGFLILVYGTMAYKGLLPIPCAKRPVSAIIDGVPRSYSSPSATGSWIA